MFHHSSGYYPNYNVLSTVAYPDYEPDGPDHIVNKTYNSSPFTIIKSNLRCYVGVSNVGVSNDCMIDFRISIFEAQYSLIVDDDQISATQVEAVSVETMATKLANVSNPQGVSYEVNFIKIFLSDIHVDMFTILASPIITHLKCS